jgi:hypothetical protein
LQWWDARLVRPAHRVEEDGARRYAERRYTPVDLLERSNWRNCAPGVLSASSAVC